MDERSIDRRRFVVGSAAAAATLATAPAFAQDAYPSRPVTFVNPFPPGGAVDVVGRPFAAVMEPLLKQPLVVETKAGAAGAVGAQFVPARSRTATRCSPTCRRSPALQPWTSCSDANQNSRAPISSRSRASPKGRWCWSSTTSSPTRTLKELVDDAKKRPNGIIFSSSGLYGALHLPTALFMQAAGIQMRHLPTAGGGPALNAILGNNAQVLVSSIAAANAQAKAGKLQCARLLLVEARRRRCPTCRR